jgi:peptidoglycan/LPS O-acetylase OafA/YrhL
MNSSDPIPDIAPEEKHQEGDTPLATSPNSALLYIGVAIPLIIAHAIAWTSLKYMIINRISVLSQNSSFLLFLWLIPIFGLVSSILFPTLGGTLGWMIALSVLAVIPILASLPFALIFGVGSPKVPSSQ